MAKEIRLKLTIILSIICFAIITRIILPPFLGHPSNFSPIDAVALFSGAYFSKRFSSFFVTLLSVWMGDLFINRIYLDHWSLFYSGFYWQYGSYLLISLIGWTLANRITSLNVVKASVLSSLLFFIISNFGVWVSGFLYPLTFNGLVACYIAAIPFFKTTLVSDLFYSIILFGSLVLARKRFPDLSLKHC